MAESQLTVPSPFSGHLAPGRHGRRDGQAGVVAREILGTAIISITARRGQVEALALKAREIYGIGLPMGPKRVGNGQLDFTWAGPGRWLATRTAGATGELATEIAECFGGLATHVDLSHALAVLRVSGPKVREVLVKGVTVDLHSRAFETGQTAMTTVSHIAVQITQVSADPVFEIAVPRSFAGSFWHWLEASAAEFGLEVPVSPL